MYSPLAYLTQFPCANLFQLEQVKTMYRSQKRRQTHAQSQAAEPDSLATANRLDLMESRQVKQYNAAYKLYRQDQLDPHNSKDFILPSQDEIKAEWNPPPPSKENIQIQPETPPPLPSDPVEFARQALGIDPDEHQQKVLLVDDKNIILNCARQWGKSTTVAIKVVHYAHFHPDSTIVIASKTIRQSGELMMKIERFLDQAQIPTTGDGINPISLVLPNQSRILAVPAEEANIRGISAVDLLIIDEAARVKASLYAAARPMLATRNGKIILMSTPWAKSGFFFDEWREGDPEEWFKLAIPATECPRIPQKFLERERKRMGARHFKQEYLCEFLDSEYQLFPRELLDAAIDWDLKPLPGFEEEE